MKTTSINYRRIIGGAVLVATVLAFPFSTASVAQDNTQSADGAAQLQALLDEAGIFYQRQESSTGEVRFRIALESSDGKSTIVTCFVRTWSWKRPDGSPTYSVVCFAQVAPPPAEGELYSRAVLSKVAEENEYIYMGNYSATKEGIFANIGFFLANLDKDTLDSYLWNLHFLRINLATELQPIFAAEAQ